ncbi:MAG TPA: transposase [Kofleriaceae bacterium]|nr:transposase [Kofleriaceae bacterium]
MAKTKWQTPEFKANAVRVALESDKPITEVARDLGINYGTLYNWMWKAGVVGNRADTKSGASSSSASSASKSDAEIRKLKRQLAELTMERDFLKKWVAFSTQKTSK